MTSYKIKNIMAKVKTHKINTVFEKIKEGKLSLSDKSSFKSFSSISYFKKKELISPHLHKLDENVVDVTIDNYINNDQFVNNSLHTQTVSRINLIHKKNGSTSISSDEINKQIKDVYKKFPKEVVRDIFNQYYSDIKKLKFDDRGQNNKQRYRMIDRANDPVIKVITKESNIKSLVFCRNMVQYLLSMLVIMKNEDPQQFEEYMNQIKQEGNNGNQKGNNQSSQSNQQTDDKGNNNDKSSQQEQQQEQQNNGSSNGAGKSDSDQVEHDNSTLEKMLKKFLDKPDTMSQNMYESAMDQAKDTSKKIEQTMTQEEINELWDNLSDDYDGKESSKLNDYNLSQVYDALMAIDMNGDKLKPHLKKILDRSLSYFQGKEENIYDEFLNNPAIDSVLDFEFLHLKLRKFALEDIQVRDTRKIGKINVYIDKSGSMNGSAHIKDTPMSLMQFAQAVVLRLKKMDVINELYIFDTKIKKKNTELVDILKINSGGGTSLDSVVIDIEKKGVNAIVITDADDSIYTYSDKAFFIGIPGSKFSRCRQESLNDYVKNKQLIQFDGENVYNIGINGHAIK